MANKIGSLSQPKLRSIRRKMNSIGTVTKTSVIMTSRGDGPVSLKLEIWEAAACREVERREINIDPTLPGKPTRIRYSVVGGDRRESRAHH